MKQNVSKIEYYDFRESFRLDIGAPVFVSEDHFGIVNSLESFKFAFEHVSDKFLQTFNIATFKSLFNQASKHFRYPKTEAQTVLDDCVTKMEQARNNTINV